MNKAGVEAVLAVYLTVFLSSLLVGGYYVGMHGHAYVGVGLVAVFLTVTAYLVGSNE